MLLLLSMDIEAETSEKTFYGVELLTVVDFFFFVVCFVCFFLSDARYQRQQAKVTCHAN